MKKYSIIIALFIVIGNARAQTIKHVADFSKFQQFYNPALTGFQGAAVKSYYRDQFAGYQNAPKSLFVSGEMKLSDLRQSESKIEHGFGLSLLHESFGAILENNVGMSYSAGLNLNESLSLKAGVGLNYNRASINHNQLVLDNVSDPSYNALLNGDNNSQKFALNVGVALVHDSYYVGYSLNDALKKETSNYFNPNYGTKHVLQVGYRREIFDQFGLIFNGIYQFEQHQKAIPEVHIKALVNRTFWFGAGYRHDLAYTVNAGVSVKQFRFGYAREINASKTNGFYKGVNEITLSYNWLKPSKSGKLNMW